MKGKIMIMVGVVIVLALGITALAAAAGASYTSYNPSVDGIGKTVCKNSIINCNIYGAKEYVWLNGGPVANVEEDGDYFFAVLEPGGQPNPNDQYELLDKNLSDDFDAYTNRIFTISTDAEGNKVLSYSGDHWLDSNTQAPGGCKNGNGPQACDGPDGLPPYIRLFPYSDTTNNGGVYILAVCSLEDGYPVVPRDCKYDAFKVKDGRTTYDIFLNGYKVHDLEADGNWNNGDYGLSGWTITITGTGFLGEPIDDSVLTGEGGYWEWGKNYVFNGSDKPVTAYLTVCEELQDGWIQSAPDSCYDLTLETSALAEALNLNFLNYQPIDIKACKFTDDYNEATDPVPFVGWEMYLIVDEVETGPFLTGEDGCYSWDDLDPGHEYAVRENDPLEWFSLFGNTVDFGVVLSGEGPLYAEFVNVPAQGCTPGFWQGGVGADLWNEVSDPDWVASGGNGFNPYIHTDDFCSEFGCPSDKGGGDMWYYVNPNEWPNASDDFDKAARSLVAAYLNTSWGVNYAYSAGELISMWGNALLSGDFAGVHSTLDWANNHFGNPVGDCPISGGY
jgi:hypothetical protein